jgi:hypothetical protein
LLHNERLLTDYVVIIPQFEPAKSWFWEAAGRNSNDETLWTEWIGAESDLEEMARVVLQS